MVLQRSDKELVVMQPNLGFLKLALELKLPLFLMYAFGENQLYTTSKSFLTSRLWIADNLRIGLPWISGRYGLGLGCVPFIPVPKVYISVRQSRWAFDV